MTTSPAPTAFSALHPGPRLTILGFPKCGTTALMRALEADPGIHVLRSPEGRMELAWPQITAFLPGALQISPDRILAHKFTAYVYQRQAIRHLATTDDSGILVLCIRDPARALVSWHNFHRKIARSEGPSAHRAWRERDFYADCAIGDYYRRYAEPRLQYDRHLDALLTQVPVERLVVVSQERMAQGLEPVVAALKALARGAPDIPADLSGAGADDATTPQVHRGYADRTDEALSPDIAEELAGVRQRLAEMVATRLCHRLV